MQSVLTGVWLHGSHLSGIRFSNGVYVWCVAYFNTHDSLLSLQMKGSALRVRGGGRGPPGTKN